VALASECLQRYQEDLTSVGLVAEVRPVRREPEPDPEYAEVQILLLRRGKP
jgi:hypothetical protein